MRTTRRVLLAGALLASSVAVVSATTGQAATGDPVLMNEVLASTTSTDAEYIELYGTPGASLAGLSVIVVESDIDASNIGNIDSRVDLPAAATLGGNGFFLLASPQAVAVYGVTPDLEIPNNFIENSSTTIALVETATITGTTVDAGIVARDALGNTDGDVGDTFFFDAPVLGPDGTFLPAGWGRTVDGVDTDTTADWSLLSFNNASPPNTPTSAAQPLVINATLVSTTSTDVEYVELFGTPGTSLDGLSIITVESDDQSSNGSIDSRFDLGPADAIGDNGFFLLGNDLVQSELGVTPNFSTPDNSFENSSITIALAATASITGTTATDVGTVLDSVALTDGEADSFFFFGAPVLGPDGSFFPPGVRRSTDGVDTNTVADWGFLVFSPRNDPANVPTAGTGDGGGGPTPATVHEIQGAGAAVEITSPVRVQAIVTSLFTRDDLLDGFFIQEEDADADGDAATSEGIFVFCRGNCPAMASGDLVTVDGTPEEFFGMSQIDMSAITIDSSGNPLPSATSINLPALGSTSAEATFESTEGMIVEFPNVLAVSEYFELARYGQVVLTDSARPYQFTDQHAPSPAGYAAFLDGLATHRIILDDDNNDQNDIISDGPDEAYYYPTGGLSVGNRFRGGDTVTGLTGVMHWSFAGQSGTDAWRIRPIQGLDYTFESANPATTSPADVGGSITAASFNVLNLFSTIDLTSSNNVGDCGPSGTQDCRGADSEAELTRQQAKITEAIAAIDADIVGLIELENDGDDASASDLVGLLNAATAPGTYDYIATGFVGDDAIKVGMIFQPAQVTPVGDFAVLDSSVDPRFLDSKNRPMLVQTFIENDTAAQVTVAVNHLKSKGSGCDDVGDPDRNDGQSSCPGTRTAAAEAIADFLATDPTNAGDADMLLLGDLNSYAMEDPIMALRDAGYTDLLDAFVGSDAYTYVFDGQLGYLDYALANSTLLSQVTGATAWHINADEIPVFDYNDDIRDTGEASFERESGVLPVYAPNPLRSSDHDPVIVGLDLQIDPAFAIATLIDRVDALEADGALNEGQANSLRRSLGSAIRQLDRGRANAAVSILTGVISQLEDFVDDGVLTADEAALLLPVVIALRDQIA